MQTTKVENMWKLKTMKMLALASTLLAAPCMATDESFDTNSDLSEDLSIIDRSQSHHHNSSSSHHGNRRR